MPALTQIAHCEHIALSHGLVCANSPDRPIPRYGSRSSLLSHTLPAYTKTLCDNARGKIPESLLISASESNSAGLEPLTGTWAIPRPPNARLTGLIGAESCVFNWN